VKNCSLRWKGINAHGKANVLGTIPLSVLAGHRRYAHLTAHSREQLALGHWVGYPILTCPEVPELRVESIDGPDQTAYGAGEAATSKA
jgi:hypothetical protein